MKHLTQSMIGMLARCAAQFERVYVNGERIPPGIAGRRGSSTHEAMRLNHAHKAHAGEDLPLDVLQDAARDEYNRLVNTEGVYIPKEEAPFRKRLLNEGLNAAVRLTGLYHDEVAPAIRPMPGMIEERIIYDLGLPLMISCGLDLFTEDLWLPDFKTSGVAKNQAFADTSLQLTLYAGAVFHRKGIWPAKCSLDVLVDSKTATYQHLETARGPKDLQNLQDRLEVLIRQIYSGLFPPCDPGFWLCTPRWCGFYNSCKYSSKRRSL